MVLHPSFFYSYVDSQFNWISHSLLSLEMDSPIFLYNYSKRRSNCRLICITIPFSSTVTRIFLPYVSTFHVPIQRLIYGYLISSTFSPCFFYFFTVFFQQLRPFFSPFLSHLSRQLLPLKSFANPHFFVL